MNSSVKSVDWWCLTFTKCKGNLFCSVSSVRMCEVQANEYQPCCLQLSASKANISLCHSQTWYPSMVPAGYSKKLKWTVMGLADLASVDFSSATPSPSSPSLPATLTVWSLLPSTNTSSFLQPWVRTELVSSAGLRCSLATYFGPRNLSTRQVCPLQTEALRGSLSLCPATASVPEGNSLSAWILAGPPPSPRCTRSREERSHSLVSHWLQRLQQYKLAHLGRHTEYELPQGRMVRDCWALAGAVHSDLDAYTLLSPLLALSHFNVFCASFKTLGKVCSSTSFLRWD